MSNDFAQPASRFRGIHSSVVSLGVVSLFMDISSEMIHSLLPLFLVGVLGTSAATFGFIEGIAEAATAFTKLVSGTLSDWLGKRKPLLVCGYGVAALTRPIFPLASSASAVLLARIVDRIAKGLRGAPRDALVADVTPPELRGAAYGLRQSLDSIGAFLGPVAAMGLMVLFQGDVRPVFWWAGAPALASVLVVIFFVREPPSHLTTSGGFSLEKAGLRSLSTHYWLVVTIGGVFTLARFSEGFLLLRARDVGFSLAMSPIALVLMNVAYVSSAYPLGRLADVLDRRWLLAAGAFVLVIADVVLAQANGAGMVIVGSLLWGLHMGATQGLLAALVADSAPSTLRGTAFGVFNMVTGAAVLGASTIAGALWTNFGAPRTFLVGAGFAALSTIGVLLIPKRHAGMPLIM